MSRRAYQKPFAPKNVPYLKRRYRMGSIYFDGGHTFDLNDVFPCHAWSTELVNPGSMCKREKATVVSKLMEVVDVIVNLSSSPQVSEA